MAIRCKLGCLGVRSEYGSGVPMTCSKLDWIVEADTRMYNETFNKDQTMLSMDFSANL